MIGRRNSTPVPIPPAVRSGDTLSARWANRMRDAIRALRDRVVETSPQQKRTKPYNQLEVRRAWVNAATGNASCNIEPGALLEHRILPEDGESPKRHPFTYNNATHLSNTVIGVSNAKSVWAKYVVGNTGAVNGTTVELVVESTNSNSFYRWWPDDPDGPGREGTVQVELASFRVTGNTVTYERKHDGNLEYEQESWIGNNLGGGARPFRRHDGANNKYDFRSLVDVSNNARIPINETAEEIEFDFNGGVSTRIVMNTCNTYGDTTELLSMDFEDGLLIRVDGSDTPPAVTRIEIPDCCQIQDMRVIQ